MPNYPLKKCSVRGCYSKGKNSDYKFHRFPDSLIYPQLFQKWIDALNRNDFFPTRKSWVCSRHFDESDYETVSYTSMDKWECSRTVDRAVLKHEAIPHVDMDPDDSTEWSMEIPTQDFESDDSLWEKQPASPPDECDTLGAGMPVQEALNIRPQRRKRKRTRKTRSTHCDPTLSLSSAPTISKLQTSPERIMVLEPTPELLDLVDSDTEFDEALRAAVESPHTEQDQRQTETCKRIGPGTSAASRPSNVRPGNAPTEGSWYCEPQPATKLPQIDLQLVWDASPVRNSQSPKAFSVQCEIGLETQRAASRISHIAALDVFGEHPVQTYYVNGNSVDEKVQCEMGVESFRTALDLESYSRVLCCQNEPKSKPSSQPIQVSSVVRQEENQTSSSSPLKDLIRTSSDFEVQNLEKSKELLERQRRLLAHIVIQHLLNKAVKVDPEGCALNYVTLKTWASYIKEFFPSEVESRWFRSPTTTKHQIPNGVVAEGGGAMIARKPSGRLWDKYIYERKRFVLSDGTHLPPRKKKSRSELTAATLVETSSTDPPPNLSELYLALTECPHFSKVQDFETTDTRIGIEPLDRTKSEREKRFLPNEIREAWKACYQQRRSYLEAAGFYRYLSVVRAVTCPEIGSNLIDIDFSIEHPSVTQGSLRAHLKLYAPFIYNKALVVHATSSGEIKEAIRQLINLRSQTEEFLGKQFDGALLLLPYLIHGGKNGGYKRLIKTVADTMFVLLSKSLEDAKRKIKAFLVQFPVDVCLTGSNKHMESEANVLPQVVAVGDDWSTIRCYYVVLGDVVYTCNDLLDAVHVCFASFSAFQLEYHPEIAHVWRVVQRLFYNNMQTNAKTKLVAGELELVAYIEEASCRQVEVHCGAQIP